MQDWVIRNEGGIAVVRVEGKDYVEIPETTEDYDVAYPDQVKFGVIERDGEKIKVVLGPVRLIQSEVGGVRQQPAKPQTVWLTPYIKKQ